MKRGARWLILIGLIVWPCAAQTTEPATEPVTQPTTAPATEPFEEFNKTSTTQPATDPTTESTTEPATEPCTEPTTQPCTQPTTSPTTHPTSQPVVPIPLVGMTEGVLFTDHVGQLANRSHSREVDFIFEKDGKLMYAPVLPNLELMRMENAMDEAGAKLRFHAMGRITEYKTRNYLLIDHASLAEEPTSEPSSVR